MHLYLIRHGKTKWNENNLIQGNKDLPLSINGIKEIQKLKAKTDQLDYEICISSSLKRAKETANILVGNRCKILYDDRIRERKMGLLEGYSTKKYNKEKYWDYNYQKEKTNVETPKELLKRTKEFLDEIKIKYPDKKILIISHSGTIKALYYNIIGYDENTNLTTFYANHNEIFKFEI